MRKPIESNGRSRWILLAVLLIAAVAARDVRADAPSMRLGTWNVWDWRTDVAAISRLAAEVDADVWCLQEANGGRFDPLFVDVPQVQAGQSLTVHGVHITSVHLSVSGSGHYAAMQTILARVPQGPGIIVGDFNETPDGRDTYGRAWDLLAMHALQEAGWVRIDTPVQPESDLPCAAPGASLTHGCGRIDQIWLSRELEHRVLDCGIPPSPWIRDGEYLSDHAPVWATVRVPEPATVFLLFAVGLSTLALRGR